MCLHHATFCVALFSFSLCFTLLDHLVLWLLVNYLHLGRLALCKFPWETHVMKGHKNKLDVTWLSSADWQNLFIIKPDSNSYTEPCQALGSKPATLQLLTRFSHMSANQLPLLPPPHVSSLSIILFSICPLPLSLPLRSELLKNY